MAQTVQQATEAVNEAFIENNWFIDGATDRGEAVTMTWVTVNGNYHARVVVQPGSIYVDVFKGIPAAQGDRAYHLHLDLTLDLDAEFGATVVHLLAAHYDKAI